jgi:hypothetical protein
MAISFFAVCAIFTIALGIMLGRYICPRIQSRGDRRLPVEKIVI